MSADGKIADVARSPARFGSKVDKTHLEKQIATADGVLFGAGTLRAYGTTLTVSHPELILKRIRAGKPSQPVHIVLTDSAHLDPEMRFFQQPIKRWLITTTAGAIFWQNRAEFERVMTFETATGKVDIATALKYLTTLGIAQLSVLGGGDVVASLLALKFIDEIWLTVCPIIIGGAIAPTPVSGIGFLADNYPQLELLEVERINQEVFLHYRLI
ncbi:riboflavin deaminase [Calothrix sp. 336/3]|nr:riboflavin deaminase [Calothrix sp. 336/3]